MNKYVIQSAPFDNNGTSRAAAAVTPYVPHTRQARRQCPRPACTRLHTMPDLFRSGTSPNCTVHLRGRCTHASWCPHCSAPLLAHRPEVDQVLRANVSTRVAKVCQIGVQVSNQSKRVTRAHYLIVGLSGESSVHSGMPPRACSPVRSRSVEGKFLCAQVKAVASPSPKPRHHNPNAMLSAEKRYRCRESSQ